MPRMFIAIPLPEKIRAELKKTAECLRSEFKHSKLTYTDPATYHITLHFLGDLSDTMVEVLKTNLSHVRCPESFHVHLEKLTAFPSVKNPKTIIVQTSTHPFLHVLRRRIANELVSLGIPIDGKPFTPHVTLARVTTRAETLRPDAYCLLLQAFSVQSFTLMESTLTPQGAIHTVRSTYPLLPSVSLV